jgi:hypothetical protein
VLEGSVRKAGNRVRVTAQLIDASTDEHLWSETFDRTLTAEDLFAIQDEIAAATVSALRAKLGGALSESAPATPVRTTKVEAYELFLEARALFQARRDLGTADGLLSRAIEIDPQFADALAIRAGIHQFGGSTARNWETSVRRGVRGAPSPSKRWRSTRRTASQSRFRP